MADYIYYIIAAISALVLLFTAYRLLGIAKVKQWLKWAVCEAEKQLGSGTGQLKLATVYAMMLDKFPFFSKILPFAVFSKLVDEALETMREWLSSNNSIATIIGGG